MRTLAAHTLFALARLCRAGSRLCYAAAARMFEIRDELEGKDPP